MKMLLAVLGMSLALAAPAAASSECTRPSAGAKILDATLVRPLALVGAVGSAGIFFGTLPISFLTGTSSEAAYVFWAAPARFAVARKLGDYRNYRDGLNIYGTSLDPARGCF